MLHVPRSGTGPPPPGRVRRRAVEAVLDAGADRDLTLVRAPAGFGKTAALAGWVRSRPGTTVWVGLRPGAGLARAILAAVAALPEVPAALRDLATARPTGPGVLPELLDGLTELRAPARLVLDDVHHLRGHGAQHDLEVLVGARPPDVRLVLAGRRDPVLPLPRWRLEERLLEVHPDDLAFGVAETAALLELRGLRLAARDVALLHMRTGGWPAGLGLAARTPDPERLAHGAGAAQLVGEVLDDLADHEREVLRRVSIAERVPAGLAVALTGRDDAAEVLEDLAHSTGLVRAGSVPGVGFRLVDLLRTPLEAGLRREDPALAADLHRRAARWASGHARSTDALAHAERAGAGLAAAVLVSEAPRLTARGELAALESALRTVGSGDPAGPDVAAVRATATAHVHLDGGRPDAARAALRDARRVPVEDGTDAARYRAATERLLGYRAPAGPGDPGGSGGSGGSGDSALAAFVRVGRGAGRLVDDDGRDTGDAATDLVAGIGTARRLGLDLLELQGLGLLGPALWASGEVHRAVAVADEALALATTQGRGDSPWAALARAVVAHGALLRADPALARRAAGGGGAPAGVAGGIVHPALRFALGAARGGALFDLGHRSAGLLALQTARAEVVDEHLPAVVAVTGALLEAGSALSLGHPTAAAGVASWLAARHPTRPEVRLIRGWICSAADAHDAAHAAIAPLLAGAPGPVPGPTAVEAWLLESRGRLARGDRSGARGALRRALALAEPLDVRRPFAHAGALRALLVDELVPGAPRRDFVARALVVPGDAAPAIALSTREHDVLSRLPSLGSLDDIAADLDVSINTVKTHVRAIYGKLGVSARRAAVLAAHEHGLLG